MRTWRRRLTDIEAFESIYNPGKLPLLGPFVALLLVYWCPSVHHVGASSPPSRNAMLSR
jgi:hypothetical protein